MVSAGWWLGTPPVQRQNLIAGRMLILPDGTWWLFGAWGRWYRWTPADGQWHLCPPPWLAITRMSARPLQQGMPVPQVPPHVVPTGPDLAYDPPSPLAFVDAGIRPEVTSRVRATVESAAALPTPDHPHWWGLFSSAVPSTVPVTWGVTLWCATAPVFDSRIDTQLLGLWSSYHARPLPEIDGPRWLTPPPLESLIGLYAERLRAGRVDSAVVILRTMWAIAGALREDTRFQPRADALIAMLDVTLQNPTIDYGVLSYGDQAVVQQWLTRCPPALAPALRVEASAGEHFRNAYYDLADTLTPVAGDPSERGYVEPRLIAAALLAADLAVVRQDVSSQVIGWLDPQVSGVMRAMLIQRDHPLRRFWPEGDRMPRSVRERMDAAGPAVRNTLLATMYGADLAWCRLGGGIPARPRGFPSSVAILAEIVGPRRATSAASTEPAPQAPGIAPLAHQYPAIPGTPGRTPGVPMAQDPPTGPPGQAPSWATPSATPPPPATEAWDGARPWQPDGDDEQPKYATLLDPLDSSADQAKNTTYVDWIGGTLADAGPIPFVAPSLVTPGPPRTRMIEEQTPADTPDPPETERPGTRIMSGTMVGGLLGVAPMPEKPVEQIAPPTPAPMPKVAERFGIRFLSGTDDATELFDDLRRKATASPPVPPPALLIVGDPHTGQRRLTRLIARTLAGAGVGDGSVRTADGADLRGDHATTVAAILRRGGSPLLFERLDRAILDASDPDRVVPAVTRARANNTVLIATSTPESYARLAGRYSELARAFKVFRLPDLSGVGSRLALLHVLADERRVTINASGLDVVRGDLARLGGHGDLVGARLVKAYLDRAVSRHTEREGVPRDRMVLMPVDFAGVAEDLEPVLRPPRDVDGFLRGLEEMIGLDEVKRTVGGLVAEARMAADRATRGLPSGNPSRHLIFLGRPGTGKATVAGLIGGIYAALNLLDSGHLVVCGAHDFAGGDTGAKVAAHVDRAAGGVLLIEDAHLLDRMSAAVDELARLMAERRDKFMVVCAGLPDEMEGFLLANPGFRAEFGAIIEFGEPTERQLVQLFSRLAERDLFMLDEELRVELLDRFTGIRRYPGFAFADTVRRLFDQIVVRQASRLAGAQVNPAAVARLSIRDLPESEGGRLLEQLHPNRLRRSPE
jgi:hypothetical protein